MERASGERFDDIEACLRATHRQAWQLAHELTHKFNERKVTLNGEL